MTAGLSNVSVVICAYTEERWSDLIAAVASVNNQTIPPREIILVVDHDPQLLLRAHTELGQVVVVENRGPRGLSGARNTGIAVAGGEVIAFMDEDAAAAPDWLARLIRHYDDPRIMGVGGAIEPVWQNGRPKWFPVEFDWVVGCTYRGMPEAAQCVRNLIGCNMSFRQEVFQKVGGFRSEIGRIGAYPAGCEETELCIRLNRREPGGQLLYEPRSRVYHQVPEKRAGWRYFIARCYSEGRSKALVSRFVGAVRGLSSEWAYTFQTLPRGIKRGLLDTLRRRDTSGLARSAAIVTGLGATGIGYVVGLILLCLGKDEPSSTLINLAGEQV